MTFTSKTQVQIRNPDGSWRDFTGKDKETRKAIMGGIYTEYRVLESYENSEYQVAWYEMGLNKNAPWAEILPVRAVFEWRAENIYAHTRDSRADALKRIGTVMSALLKYENSDGSGSG